jgi:hypothetical protein
LWQRPNPDRPELTIEYLKIAKPKPSEASISSNRFILTRFSSRRDMVLVRQVTELTNQRARFDVNPEPLNP